MARPSFFKDEEALRFALNANPVFGLMPCIRRTTQPTYVERLWLFVLYMTTGVFLEHLALLYGPICRHAYVEQCGADGYERLTGVTPSSEEERRLDVLSNVEGAGDELETTIQSTRLSLLGVLSGKVPLNCEMTKCDHWEHITLDDNGNFVSSLFTHIGPSLSPSGEEASSAVEDKHTYTFVYWPGMCRCQHTYLQKMTFRVAVALASVVFQTILINVLQAVLKKDWEERGGFRAKAHKCVMGFLTLVLFGEITCIFLIRFVPEAWLISMVVSGVTVVSVNFIAKYTQAHLQILTIPDELKNDYKNLDVGYAS